MRRIDVRHLGLYIRAQILSILSVNRWQWFASVLGVNGFFGRKPNVHILSIWFAQAFPHMVSASCYGGKEM